MKAVLSKIFVPGLLTMLFFTVHAQNLSYTSPGGLKMGFGLGSSYQASDIKNSKGGGFDLWLGTPIYQRENAFFALDWRFRFLAGYNRAYDHRMNIDSSYNNIHLTHFNYDLELALTLNRLRERTRIILTGFFGAGITHGITSADLLDASNNSYDYSSILPNRDPTEILADLDQLTDKDFETRLSNKASILPTAGIYLGYEFTPHFALGLEHKMNFSLSEHNSTFGIDMDNQVLKGSSLDFNNYTSIVFRWKLGGGSPGKSTVSAQDPDLVTTPVVYPPQVDIITPYTDPYDATESSVKVTARILNITRQEDISVKLNGQNQDFVLYNSINRLEINTNLLTGSNSLEIFCQNEAGSDSDDLILRYRTPTVDNPDEIMVSEKNAEGIAEGQTNITYVKPESGPPPEVKILRPFAPRSSYSDSRAEILAEISNIESRSELIFRINGMKTDDFSYNPSTKSLHAIVPLNSSNTRVFISAQNRFGSDSDSRIIIRETQPMQYQPVQNQFVQTQPIQTQPVQTQPVQTQTVQTQHVQTRPGHNPPVQVQPVQTQPVQTRPGHNPPVQVQPVQAKSGHNPPVQKPPVQKPPVQTQPCNPPLVSFNISEVNSVRTTHQLKGNTKNLNNKGQVTLTVNGRRDIEFRFVPATGEISRNFRFDPGSYTIVVSVNNECGNDSESKQLQVIEIQGNEPGEDKNSSTDAGWVRINPGNASWEFCLQTVRGNYNRNDLSNPGFSYSGTANSLYIKPIAGGGKALVNGRAFNLNPGQYYLFSGNLKVQVTNKRQGAMGQWSVYVESSTAPSTGKGNNRPDSPCETGNKNRNR